MLELWTGERHPVHDANEVHTDDDNPWSVHFIHYADNGSVNVNFDYADATECVQIPSGFTTTSKFDVTKDSPTLG